MSTVGHHPESGVRLELERPREGGPPWTYEGALVTPEERFGLRAVVEQNGTVAVELAPPARGREAPASLVERTRLLIRTAYRHARDEDPEGPPPRRIVRWRP